MNWYEPPPPPYEHITTLMVSNIPPQITQREFAARIDISGFKDMYDFLYLPHHWHTNTPMGYAFINFKTVGFAGQFIMKWNGRRLLRSDKTPKIHIAKATYQGRDALIALCKRQRTKNPAFRPIVASRPS